MSTYDQPPAPRGTGRKTTRTPRADDTRPAPAASGRRAISTGGAIFIITVGATLLFALTADASPDWINLRVVGFILILAGVAGLWLPRLKRSPTGGYRRWMLPMTPEEERPGPDELNPIRRTDGDGDDYPTLADELLREEHDPPIAGGGREARR